MRSEPARIELKNKTKQNKKKKQVVEAQAFNPSIPETRTGGLLRLAWSTEQVPGKPRLNRENLCELGRKAVRIDDSEFESSHPWTWILFPASIYKTAHKHLKLQV